MSWLRNIILTCSNRPCTTAGHFQSAFTTLVDRELKTPNLWCGLILWWDCRSKSRVQSLPGTKEQLSGIARCAQVPSLLHLLYIHCRQVYVISANVYSMGNVYIILCFQVTGSGRCRILCLCLMIVQIFDDFLKITTFENFFIKILKIQDISASSSPVC